MRVQSLPRLKSHYPLQYSSSLQNKICSSNFSDAMQLSIEQRSDKSSLSNSIELEPLNDCDCDRGFGSMSSANEQVIHIKLQNSRKTNDDIFQNEVAELKDEVTKLKCDKLDLLRQNVVKMYFG